MASKSVKSLRPTPYSKPKKIVQNVKLGKFKTETIDVDKSITPIQFTEKNESFEKLLVAEQKVNEVIQLLPPVKVPIPVYFVVAFSPPIYPINFVNRISETTVQCTNINENLLFSNIDLKMINFIAPSNFKLLINNKFISIQNVTYDKSKNALKIVINKYTDPIKKSVIYFCLFNVSRRPWTVPKYLVDMFNN
ncbi:hypothetical protein [Parapoynx stagnalis nucleopolyhedrovirus]|uniref:Uncharacterized protein n=1 Tax=Parapoynx stagnalis nucleopolyhedrovirus TaxID=2993413 RepID=A0A9E8C0C8_9ABAC|nr:hypothetical protein [Parapoynx stagnalis nucleopolyhedrovirus]